MNLLNSNLHLTGRNEHDLLRTLNSFDDCTEYRDFYADNLSVVSIIKKRVNVDGTSLLGVRINPDEVTPEAVLTNTFMNSANLVVLNPEKQMLYGLGTSDIEDILSSGFYFEHVDSEDTYPEILIPQKRFLTSFCKALHVGKLKDEGYSALSSTLFRDIYIANLMQTLDNEKIYGIIRMNAFGAGKWLGVMSARFRHDTHKEALLPIEKIRKKHPLTLQDWSVDQKETIVNYIVNELDPVFETGRLGFQYKYSDIGDCSNTIIPALFFENGVSFIGKEVSVSHCKGNSLDHLVAKFEKDVFPIFQRFLLSMKCADSVRVDDPETIINRYIRKIGLSDGIGEKRTASIIEDLPSSDEIKTMKDVYEYLYIIPSRLGTNEPVLIRERMAERFKLLSPAA